MYVHLGINDIHQGECTKETMENIWRNKYEQAKDISINRLFLRDNAQFFTDRLAGILLQNTNYFQQSDSVHLSHLGRKVGIRS